MDQSAVWSGSICIINDKIIKIEINSTSFMTHTYRDYFPLGAVREGLCGLWEDPYVTLLLRPYAPDAEGLVRAAGGKLWCSVV